MKSKTCCFTGHRKLPSNQLPYIQKHLEKQVIKLIHQGVIYYGAGGALGFDTAAAQTILQLKNRYPQIKLILVLPCTEQTKGWNHTDLTVYQTILQQADKVVYTSQHDYAGCLHKRNRHLVDHANYCI